MTYPTFFNGVDELLLEALLPNDVGVFHFVNFLKNRLFREMDLNK
jgi:hypothetical protein